MTDAFARALIAQNRLEAAEQVAWYSVKRHETICSQVGGIPMAEAQKTYIRTLSRQEKYSKLVEFDSYLKNQLVDQPGRYRQLFGANPDLVVANLLASDLSNGQGSKNGRIQNLEIALKDAVQKFGEGSLDVLKIKALIGLAHKQAGNFSEAVGAFDESLPAMISQLSHSVESVFIFEKIN